MKKIIVLTLASLSLMTGLAAAQATPGRTTDAPPPVPANGTNAELSALTSKLATLHLKRDVRPSARELKALGLKPVPKPMAARFKQLSKSNRARAATVGSTYWFPISTTAISGRTSITTGRTSATATRTT